MVVEAVRPLKAVEEVAKVTAPVRVLPGMEMEETTLAVVGRQVLPTEKQPAVRLIPLAKVELAVFEVALKIEAERPAAKVEVPCPAPTVMAAAKVEVAVVEVATRLVTYSTPEVATRVEPSEEETMMLFGEKEVALVPPLATVSKPLMVERVEVATQPGTPFTDPRTKPPVPIPSLERTLVAEE
jgi:hypothetical protein